MAETKRTILERVDHRLDTLDQRLDRLEALAGVIAATSNQTLQGVTMANAAITQLISDFNTETNAIQARLDRLTTSLADVATPEQIAELNAISARLTALGQDPNNPIPPAG